VRADRAEYVIELEGESEDEVREKIGGALKPVGVEAQQLEVKLIH
jgi:hypothetical protein